MRIDKRCTPASSSSNYGISVNEIVFAGPIYGLDSPLGGRTGSGSGWRSSRGIFVPVSFRREH